MKKLLLASLCMASVALTACDKKPNEAATTTGTDNQPVATQAAVALSKDVAANIKSDLIQIQTLSTNKAKEALAFQNEVTQAAQKNDKAALQGIVEKMKSYTEGFNKELDALTLKSSEVDAVRSKMKEANNLGVELSEAGLKNPPDMNEINTLQKKATEMQQALLTEMQNLQTKANTAK